MGLAEEHCPVRDGGHGNVCSSENDTESLAQPAG